MWAEQNGRCAETNIPFALLRQGRTTSDWNSATLDRVNPDEGYLRVNVRIILNCVNMLKGRMTSAQVKRVAQALLKPEA